jgi:ferredoxin
LDVVPEAADGEADFVGALMGLAEDWMVLDIRCVDECRSCTMCGRCEIFVVEALENEANDDAQRTSLQSVARTQKFIKTQLTCRGESV